MGSSNFAQAATDYFWVDSLWLNTLIEASQHSCPSQFICDNKRQSRAISRRKSRPINVLLEVGKTFCCCSC